MKRTGAVTKRSSMVETIATPKAPVATDAVEVGCSALVRAVKLRDMRLIETTARLQTEHADAFDGQLHIYTDSVKTRAARFNAETLYCGVRISIKAATAEDKPAVIELYAEYSLVYDIPAETEFSQESADLFAARNGVFNAWPFFRELAHSSTGRMGLPALTMASFKLPLLAPPPVKQN